MFPERWRQIEEIFQAAVDLAPEDRARYVADSSGGDQDLQREVERLLAQYEEATALIEEPLYERTTFYEIASLLDDDIDPMLGRRIGSYEIVRELGRGGMGAVYLASRADRAFQKSVAIKLVKRGMDTDFILRRFRRERQILAALDHPNIARLLDGGTTDDGRPYFVMEYIAGQPIYGYSDAGRLGINERLQLFCRVCDAVEYAHKNLIIHRDIKPSNILVTPDGTPKLLDFGIAKLLNPDLEAETSPLTATTTRLMTVEYASPEQVCGESVTFLTDVYSLGVVLYELLTGHRPYQFRNRWPHEMARVIAEEAPKPPSLAITRAEGLLPAYAADTNSEAIKYLCEVRGETPEGLQQKLSGNLDNIILKALRKAPAERYASAGLLRDDIMRHLEGRLTSGPFYAGGAAEAAQAGGGEPRTGAKTIAVLPLKLLSASAAEDTGDRFLSVGLADAMITRLSNVRSLIVRPTSAILRYGDEGADPFAAGRELGADFVLDGRIRRAGERIRVSLQLLDVSAAASVWADQFDENFSDVLELEDSISARVAEALLPQLTETERLMLRKRVTEDPRAFEAYMRGRYYWNRFTPEYLMKALESFQTAVDLDPDYALAQVGLADFYTWASIYGILPPGQCYPQAKAAALRALELDDSLGEAYAALGLIVRASEWDYEEAERLHKRSLELSPNYSLAHEWYSALLVGNGRFEEGLKEIRRAEELDMYSLRTLTLVAWTVYQARLFTEAIAKANQLIELDRHYPQGYVQLGNALCEVGRAEEAVAALERAAQLMPESALPRQLLCFALARAGRREEARRVLDELKDFAASQYLKPYFLAMAHVALDERDAAFDLFEVSFRERDPWLVWFGTEPKLDPLRDDPRFIELFRLTKNPLAMRRHAPGGQQDTGDRAIAVLPFKLLGSRAPENTDDEFLATGLADALMIRLSMVRRFIVRPTSSVLRYAQGGADPIAAGRGLGVDYVLDGNIRRAGNRLRVTAQLLHVAEGATRWAGRFDQESADVLELEDSISEQVATALLPHLSGDERLRLSKRGTGNPEAFEAYLRGRYYWNMLSEDSFAKAIVSYRRAIELDPEYAAAYAAIAEYHVWLAIFGARPPAECLAAAREAARRAVELDDSLAEAHTALGFSLLPHISQHISQWEEAKACYLRALDLNPNYAMAHVWYGDHLAMEAAFGEADAELRRACELDPLNPFNSYIRLWCLYQARRYGESIRLGRDLMRSDPRYPPAYFGLCWALRRVGEYEEAVGAAKRLVELDGSSLQNVATLGAAYAEAGQSEEARRVLAELSDLSSTRFVTPYHRALIHLHLGERDEALALLTESVEAEEPWIVWLGVEPQLDPLRDDPRFIELLRRTGNPLA